MSEANETTNPPTTATSKISTTSSVDYRAAQNQLSIHLDNIENAIAKLLKDRAGGLFESISKTEKMQNTMNQAMLNFKNLRLQNKNVRQKIVENTIKIDQNNQKKQKLEKLLENLRTISVVHSATSVVKTLENEGDYSASLDLINESEITLSNQLQTKLKCLKHAEDLFKNQKKKIQANMQNELNDLVSKFLIQLDIYDQTANSDGFCIDTRLRSLIGNICLSHDTSDHFDRITIDFFDKLRREINENIKSACELTGKFHNFEVWWDKFETCIEQMDLIQNRSQTILLFTANSIGFSSLEAVLEYGKEQTVPEEAELEGGSKTADSSKVQSSRTENETTPVAVEEIDSYGLINDLDDMNQLIDETLDMENDAEMAKFLGLEVKNKVEEQPEPSEPENPKKALKKVESSDSELISKENRFKIITQIQNTSQFLNICNQDHLQVALRQVADGKLVGEVGDLSQILAIGFGIETRPFLPGEILAQK